MAVELSIRQTADAPAIREARQRVSPFRLPCLRSHVCRFERSFAFPPFFRSDFPARNFGFVTGKILYRRGESGHCLWSERSGKEIAGLDAGKPGLELFHFGIIFLQLRKTVMILAPFLC